MTHVGVVGTGQMGRGIAQVAAQNGCLVTLVDAEVALARNAVTTVDTVLGRLVDKGKISPSDRHATMGNLTAAADLSDLADCNVVIEAVPEDEALKCDIFRRLDSACGAATILASNTSSIPIVRLADATGRPDRVVGMHFMNPVPVMKLVEIIRGEHTSDATARTVTDLAQQWGKTTIASSDTAGFIVNRMLLPFLNEAYLALEQGVGTAEDIDTGARLGLNHPMGPLELTDHVGLDTCLAVLEVLYRDLGDERYRPAEILVDHVERGRHGVKTGAGFYEYNDDGTRK